MKRKIASRKLKRTCAFCNKNFKKGEVYYLHRNVIAIDEFIEAYEYLECPKCRYKSKERARRFKEFKKTCEHPISDTVWSLIPGEDVAMEPDYEECLICGQVV